MVCALRSWELGSQSLKVVVLTCCGFGCTWLVVRSVSCCGLSCEFGVDLGKLRGLEVRLRCLHVWSISKQNDDLMSYSPLNVLELVKGLRFVGWLDERNYYRALDFNWELGAPWTDAKLKVPVKFIDGDRDMALSFPGIRDYMDNGEFKRYVPLLEEVVFLEGGGHFCNQEKPDEVNQHILGFFLVYRFSFRILRRQSGGCTRKKHLSGKRDGNASVRESSMMTKYGIVRHPLGK
ncbi:hypothetical protein Droror1_Dr00021558 [Drosera rotundifolia]